MNNEEKITRIKELTDLLNLASRTYYQEGREIMPNIDYDRYYDELLELEKETGFRLANSPSQNVGYEIISELPKERHETPMLSLDKTKSEDELIEWMHGHECVLSWKLDGITCVVTYEAGELKKAVTRGNGEIGEVVTQNARYFENLPGQIPFKGRLTVRGEAVISYSDFDKINEELEDTAARYKNPRNLCSGSVRQLDPSVTAGRHVRLVVFTLVSVEPSEKENELPDLNNSVMNGFSWLEEQGFEVVEHVLTHGDKIKEDIKAFKEKITGYDIPSDGLVLTFEDIAYGVSLGRTAKFPRNSIAFKWQDELAETTLKYIEWSGSRTGLINPIAVFEPVELEGTTVSRASVHNVSIVEELELGAGDTITVYKSNMIIPQISDNLTRSNKAEIPKTCPVCGGKTEIRRDNTAALLYCLNPECPAKKIKSFALLVGRDALNVEGLSEMKLEKLIDNGLIHEYADIFKLEEQKDKIAAMEGFGEKSASNLIEAAKKASFTEMHRFIYALGIPGIGLSGAKAICGEFNNDLESIMDADKDRLLKIRDIGPVLADNFIVYFQNEKNRAEALELSKVLKFESLKKDGGEEIFASTTFVITGDMRRFSNRREVQDIIERLGGKVSGSVSSKTNYLINNDMTSRSSKNIKAAELGIPVITEDEFIAMLPENLRP